MTPLVVSDSSCCVPPPWQDHPALRIVPITLLLGDRRLEDGPAARTALAEAADTDLLVRTLAPSPVAYVQVLDEAAEGAVVVTPAAEVAIMHRNATLASRLTTGRAVVVDCGSAGPAQGLCVAAGLHACDRGATVDEVADAVRDAAARTELAAVVWDLDELAAVVGSAEHPAATPGRRPQDRRRPHGSGKRHRRQPTLVRFQAGLPRLVASEPGGSGCTEPTGGEDPAEAALAGLVGLWASAGGPDDRAATVVFHADDQVAAERLADELADRLAPEPGGPDTPGAVRARPAIVPISPAMAAHTGPGCVGAAWLRQAR